jgi:murein DD-endopeptidase MepM/ murein hydrolase activator NlpD
MSVPATSEQGAVVSFAFPYAVDRVNGALASTCSPNSDAAFSTGTTLITCTATDGSGNSASVTFAITVDPLPVEEPTIAPTQTPANPTPEPTEVPSPTPEPTATVEPTPEITPTPAALGLPWPPPPPVNPIYGRGPIEGLALIWGGLSFPISQEYGHTLFSLSQPTLYLYGTEFGLDGRAHPGLDIGMGRGTYLYSPVNGTVVAAGGTGGFGFYGNTLPGVGELRIETAEGHQVILGHMAAIAVHPGEEVTIGQFVGLSGGDNGDHLHLETRHSVGGGYVAVDPRFSFLIPILTEYNATQTIPDGEPDATNENPDSESEPETPTELPAETDAGISDGNETTLGLTPADSQEYDQPETGISNGNGELIEAPEPEAARREEEPDSAASPDPSLFLQSLVDPPAAPVQDFKRSALDAILRRMPG